MRNKTYKIYLGLIVIFFIASCRSIDSNIVLSGNYWLTSENKMIQSSQKEFLYKNKIYPTVIDYAFDSSYILVEQLVDSAKIGERLAIDLNERFKKYQMFKRDETLLQDSFYLPFAPFVQGDSLINRLFLLKGGDSSDPASIGISKNIARELLQKDPNYNKLLKDKYNYWILDIRLDSLLGPYNFREYILKKATLAVSDNLKLSAEK